MPSGGPFHPYRLPPSLNSSLKRSSASPLSLLVQTKHSHTRFRRISFGRLIHSLFSIYRRIFSLFDTLLHLIFFTSLPAIYLRNITKSTHDEDDPKHPRQCDRTRSPSIFCFHRYLSNRIHRLRTSRCKFHDLSLNRLLAIHISPPRSALLLTPTPQKTSRRHRLSLLRILTFLLDTRQPRPPVLLR